MTRSHFAVNLLERNLTHVCFNTNTMEPGAEPCPNMARTVDNHNERLGIVRIQQGMDNGHHLFRKWNTPRSDLNPSCSQASASPLSRKPYHRDNSSFFIR
jgi:hypothetical protein